MSVFVFPKYRTKVFEIHADILVKGCVRTLPSVSVLTVPNVKNLKKPLKFFDRCGILIVGEYFVKELAFYG